MGQTGVIVRGPDGLPRCTNCHGEDALCENHRRRVWHTLHYLWTQYLLGRADGDVRYLIRRSLVQEAHLDDDGLAEAEEPKPKRGRTRR